MNMNTLNIIESICNWVVSLVIFFNVASGVLALVAAYTGSDWSLVGGAMINFGTAYLIHKIR